MQHRPGPWAAQGLQMRRSTDQPGAEWRPTTISAGEGTVAMLANTVPAQQRPGQSLRTLARALRNSCVLAGDRGEAAEAAHALFAQLASATS